jgi:hypothetical protein
LLRLLCGKPSGTIENLFEKWQGNQELWQPLNRLGIMPLSDGRAMVFVPEDSKGATPICRFAS